jgi:hypothetical protein
LKSFYLIPNKRERAIELLTLEVNELLDSFVVQLFQTSMLNNKVKNKVKKNMHSFNSLDEIFDAPENENYLQKQSLEKTEIDLHLADETRIDNNMNVLTYLSLSKSLYPNLCRIAKRIFSIPATNTSVERLFSHSGNTIPNHRTRLDADKVNNLLCIKRNM